MSESLERRLAELIEEIRRYPTPIARCDQHLAALLEERDRLIQELKEQNGAADAA
jgi:chorismate mutase